MRFRPKHAWILMAVFTGQTFHPSPGMSQDVRNLPPALNPAPSRSPLASGLNLKPAPFERTDVRFPINLATALRLSDARPLIVAAAQAGGRLKKGDPFAVPTSPLAPLLP